MHKLIVIHFFEIKRILRYLYSTSTIDIKFLQLRYLYKPFVTLIGLEIFLIDIPPLDSLASLVLIQYLDLPKSNLQVRVLPHKQNIAHSPLPLPIFTGSKNFYMIFMFHLSLQQRYGVIMFMCFMLE